MSEAYLYWWNKGAKPNFSQTMKCQFLFILSSAKLFIQFTSFFQREDLLIHLIHNEIKCLIIKIAGCIFKEQVVKFFKSDLSKDPFQNKNLISLKDEELFF